MRAAGIAPSARSGDDSYANAPAETAIGLCRLEVSRRDEADGQEQAPTIEPIDPREGRPGWRAGVPCLGEVRMLVGRRPRFGSASELALVGVAHPGYTGVKANPRWTLGMEHLRDFVGYGRRPPDPRWPGGARLALQIVVNYEEGGENCVLEGDAASEAYLSELVGALPRVGDRHLGIESIYEYGSRVGFWRLHRLFTERRLPITVFAVGLALARNPEAAAAMAEANWEVASHGWRWIDYHAVDAATEREHLRLCVETIERTTGVRPVGWYTGRVSPNTRRLVVEDGGWLYDADSYADDLPYWTHDHGRPHLVVPYTMDANDMRFAMPQGFSTGEHFESYLRDAFDQFYAESGDQPRMMSVGLHCRLVGRPGRLRALARFLDHVQAHDDVWICRRDEIARHWHREHPPRPGG